MPSLESLVSVPSVHLCGCKPPSSHTSSRNHSCWISQWINLHQEQGPTRLQPISFMLLSSQTPCSLLQICVSETHWRDRSLNRKISFSSGTWLATAVEPPRSGALVLAWTGGAPFAATALRLANVIWWGTGVTDRSVNAAIWFGLEQISVSFWGQNNAALPICGGKRTARSTAKYLRSL